MARRRYEIGVRIAVGASPAGVRGMLLGQSMVPVAAGVAAAAWRLATAAALSAWTATARVVRADPIQTLRVE